MARPSLLPLRLLAFLAWRDLGQSKLITALLCAARGRLLTMRDGHLGDAS